MIYYQPQLQQLIRKVSFPPACLPTYLPTYLEGVEQAGHLLLRDVSIGVDQALVILEEDTKDGAGGDGSVDVGGSVQGIEDGYIPVGR